MQTAAIATPPQAEPINLLGMTREQLVDYFVAMGEKRFRAQQIMQWVYQQRLTEFTDMHNIGKALQQRLGETAVVRVPEILTAQHSSDGTRKWLMALEGGNAVGNRLRCDHIGGSVNIAKFSFRTYCLDYIGRGWESKGWR